MTLSDAAAWWGAILATFIFAWDVYKWQLSGARIRVSATANMQSFNEVERKLEDDKLIVVAATNIGDKPATLTHLVIKQYKNWAHRLLGKPTMQAFVPSPGGTQPIPFVLEPGHRWTGMMDQTDVQKKAGAAGLFYCGVQHTASKKAVLARVSLT